MIFYDRVDQFHQSTDVGDAITSEMLSLRSVLRSMGYQSDVYAERVGLGCESDVLRISQYRPARRQLMLWHFSIGVDCFELLATARHDIAVVYHNITPPEFISEPLSNFYLHLGREQLRELPDVCSAAMADSNFNRRELLEAGFRRAYVLPVWSDGSRFVPPASVEARRSGDWLFVGRLIPNKRQVDLVRAFAAYQRDFDASARLVLVGNTTYRGYVEAIRKEIAAQGLTGRVELLGKVDERELLEVMWSCGAYVSLSEHEGFGVPLLEAMAAGMAVFAVGSGAVAETMGGAGVLLADRDPVTVAQTVAGLLGDRAELDRTREAQNHRVRYFEDFDRAGVLRAVIDECSGGHGRVLVAVDGPAELFEAVAATAGADFEVLQAPASGSPASGSPASGSPASGSPASGSPAAGSPAAGFPDLTVTTSLTRAAGDLTSGVVGIYRSDSGGEVLASRYGEEVRLGRVEGWRGALQDLLRKAYRPRVGFVVLGGGDTGDAAAWLRARLASLGALIVEQQVIPSAGWGGLCAADAVKMSVADVVHIAVNAGSFDPAAVASVAGAAGRCCGVVVSVHGDLAASPAGIVDLLVAYRGHVDTVVAAGGDVQAALASAGVSAHLVELATPPGALADLYRDAAAAGRVRRGLASAARR